MPHLSGKSLGQYQILESIGKGGMAEIFRAYQPSVKREVVVKVLSETLRDDPGFVEQFTQEVDVIAHLQHPHIIPIYDFGQHEEDLYIVMAYLRGGTLADRIDKSPQGMPAAELVRLMDLIADGLDYAHSKYILHRDLKPNNILMDEDENPYIADFGLARHTGGKIEITNTMMTGTAAYMAPEIARVGKSTKSSDIYALGVILFEMLTGQLPYQGKTPYNVLSAHVNQPIPRIHELRPDLPEAMQAVLDRALAKDPSGRFATARELASALKDTLAPAIERALNSTTPSPAPAAIGEVKSERARNTRLGFLAIGVLVLALAGVFAISRYNQNQVEPTQIGNPTEHTAERITNSSSSPQWGFDCLGERATALVDLDCREIRVAVENRKLPYNFIFLETNQPGGMDYDMWWEICSRLHCQPVFIQEKWETLLNRVKEGAYDAASEGITISEERRQTLAFSISYLNIEQRLVVRRGESRFSDISEFLANGHFVLGARENSTNLAAAMQYIPEDRIRSYKEYSTVFYALSTGDIDAALADQVEGQTTVTGIDFQQAINLEFMGNSLSSDQFGIVFPKDSDLVGPVNKALQDIRAQGVLDRLIARYFGSSFRVTYSDISLGAYEP
jgi:serine/threonine protein kinase